MSGHTGQTRLTLTWRENLTAHHVAGCVTLCLYLSPGSGRPPGNAAAGQVSVTRTFVDDMWVPSQQA